ncbi:MAG TPA: PIG-L family deacetylase [Blastocatellia bacterium]|jgi:LmbE family N-acetylglucosaminyl deacetylase
MKRALLIYSAITLLFSNMPFRLPAAATSFAQSSGGRYGRGAIDDERGLIALDQSLREVNNPFTLMCVAAHPDDVDEATLAYVRKNLGARAVIVFATRGEGRESPAGGTLDGDLAVVRTREALETARAVGADAFFLNLKDFGYSKSAEEALSIWGHDDALRRLVRAIRLLRPDVIITGHDKNSGGGQQQAVARLLSEAFTAAGDSKVAPEADSEAWQARRLFQKTDESSGDVTINLEQYDQARGRTYSEMGLAAHRRLVSFGAASARLAPEKAKSHYKLIASPTDETMAADDSILTGISLPQNLARSVTPPRVGDQSLLEAIGQRDRVIEALTEKLIEKRAEGSPDEMHARYGVEFFRVIRFTEALERALALAIGLDFNITIADPMLVKGQKLLAHLSLRNHSNRAFAAGFHTPEQVLVEGKKPPFKASETVGLGPFGGASRDVEYETAKDARATVPHAEHVYEEEYYPLGGVLPGAQAGEPFGHRLLAIAEVGLGQVSITLPASARFDIAPQVEISTIPFAIVKDWTSRREIEFSVRLRNRTSGELAGALWVVPLALSGDDYEPARVSFAREDEEAAVSLRLRLPILKPPLSPDVLLEFRREKPAPGGVLGSARVTVKAVDFEVAEAIKVGFIGGPDRSLSLALTALGVDHSEIAIENITAVEHGNGAQKPQPLPGCADLMRFDTILVDDFAYSIHPELIASNRCLLDYVKRGGNLIIFQQQPGDWNLILSRAQLMPYAVTLSEDRITVETAPVKILDPEHALMSKPNKITARDFEEWVRERALNLPREWAAQYTPLLESADPGEEPRRGGLLVAAYGEGSFIYTSYSWRRQLLAMNPGAYRVLANLISYPKQIKKQAAPQR